MACVSKLHVDRIFSETFGVKKPTKTYLTTRLIKTFRSTFIEKVKQNKRTNQKAYTQSKLLVR